MTSPFTYDVTSGLWTLGDGLAQMHGLTPHDVVTTQTLLDRIHLEDRTEMLQRFQHHLRHEGAYSCAYRMTDAEGQTRRLRFVGNSLAAGGRIFRLEGFVLDIGEEITQWQAEPVTASAAHRATIEQAKGVLMLAFGVDHDDAFRMLVGYSQQRNTKLREVAALVTGEVSKPPLLTPAERVDRLLRAIGDPQVDQGGAGDETDAEPEHRAIPS